MAEALTYDEEVINTFRRTALRTVLMIDDQFPTFSDLAKATCNQNGESCGLASVDQSFKERARAVRLYQMFREKQMPCDIENRIGDLEQGKEIERIRKSDLIILDYNLEPGSNDTRKSIGIMRRLAETGHFNTVVLYTASPDLDKVWLDVAISLRNGWKDPSTLLDGSALVAWEGLSDSGGEFPSVSEAQIQAYLLAGARGIDEQLFRAWKGLGASDGDAGMLAEASIHQAARDALADRASEHDGTARNMAGRCEKEHPRWLQVGNCFIAVMGKTLKDENDITVENDGIIDFLDAALKDWQPNLLQLLISEIQNTLELEPLATDEMHLLNPDVQAGLFHYLLHRVGGGALPADGATLRPGIEAVIDRLVESVRRKISSNERLAQTAAQLLSRELGRRKWPPAPFNDAAVFKMASDLAGISAPPPMADAIFKLNAFLSTEEFTRGHITTGTIVRIAGQEKPTEHWICLSPACDMEDREPTNSQVWMKGLFPVRAFVVVRLDPIPDHKMAVKNANTNHVLFLDGKDGRKAFHLVKDGSSRSAPSYEFIFPAEAGRVSINGGGYPQFRAFRMTKPADPADFCKEALTETHFEVVGQIRGQYASRFLQVIGHHFSRIGVDFVSMRG